MNTSRAANAPMIPTPICQSKPMGLIAGSGVTGSHDGSAADAHLAQPTGLARTEVGLVFCDAAASNIRLLTDSGKVATITGNGFFDWGLVDGPAHKAKLQRPSDLTVLDDGSTVAFGVDDLRSAFEAGRTVDHERVTVVVDGDGFRLVDDDGTDLRSSQANWFAWSQRFPATELWHP